MLEMIRCDCRFKITKGKKVLKKIELQPMVALRTAVDPAFLVGRCQVCNKTITRRSRGAQKVQGL